jgi:hypothetical protein
LYQLQKELEENIWNSLTIHNDKTITDVSSKDGLIFKHIAQPTTKENAESILIQIEI